MWRVDDQGRLPVETDIYRMTGNHPVARGEEHCSPREQHVQSLGWGKMFEELRGDPCGRNLAGEEAKDRRVSRGVGMGGLCPEGPCRLL